jgi:hypothetical protein
MIYKNNVQTMPLELEMNLGPITIYLTLSIAQASLADTLTNQSIADEGRLPITEGAWAVNPSGLAIDLGIKQSTYKDSSSKWVNVGIAKGIYWPFTVGLNFSANDESLAHQIGGWAQYSIFQKPLLPSLAFRVKYSQSHFGSTYYSDSKAGEVVVSYGLGPISLTASYEVSHNNVETLTPSNESAENFYLNHRTYGISAQLAFPTKISLARTIASTGKSGLLTQVSFEM